MENTQLYPAAASAKYGYLDRHGAWVIPPRFCTVGRFFENRAVASVDPGRYGHIDPHGRFVTEPIYEEVDRASEGLMAAKVAGRWGFLKLSGEVHLPIQFTRVGRFSEGRASASFAESSRAQQWDLEDFEFYIDASGQQVGGEAFAFAAGFGEGLGLVGRRGRYGYVSRAIEIVIPPAFEEASGFHRGIARVMRANKQLLIDRTGEVTQELPSQHEVFWGTLEDELMLFSDRRTGVRLYGYMDRSAAVIIPAKFGIAKPFLNGKAAVHFRGKWGLIDRTGHFVVDAKYNWLARVHDLVYFVLGDINGYMDDTGAVSWSGEMGGRVVYRMQPFALEAIS